MLNREEVRRVLVARDRVANRYIGTAEDVSHKQFLDDVLRELVKINKIVKNEKKNSNN